MSATVARDVTPAPGAPDGGAPGETDAGDSYGQILKSSALIGGSSIFNVAVAVVRAKATALLLGPAGFGLMGVYASLLELCQSVAGIGINASGVREIAAAVGSGDRERVARTATVLRRTSVVLGVTGALALVALSGRIATLSFGSAGRAGPVALLSLAVLCRILSDGQGALLQGLRRISDLVRIAVLGGSVGAAAAIALIYLLRERGVVPALVAMAAAWSFFSWRYARAAGVKTARLSSTQLGREAAALLKLGFAFMASGVLMMGSAYVVRLVIVRGIGLQAAGLYQSAWAIGGMYVGFILQAMGADFYPRLAAVVTNRADCNRLVNEQARISLLLAGPGVLATLTFAPLVVSVFYSAAFADAVGLLRWLCLGGMLRVITWPMGFIVVADAKQTLFLVMELAYAAFYVAAAWVCVGLFGVDGAGVAFLASYVFHALILYPIVRALTGFRWSAANRRLIAGFLAVTTGVFCAFQLLPGWAAVSLGVLALIADGVYSVRTLVRLVSTERVPPSIRRWLARLRLTPADRPGHAATRPVPTPSAFLEANSEAYEWLACRVGAMDPRRTPEAVLRSVEEAAWFAGDHHPGRFADGTIENLALGVGARLDADGDRRAGAPLPGVRATGRRRVLHVTPLLTVGGHTPLLYHWVLNDRSSCHSLALVNHAGEVPATFTEAIRGSGGEVVVFPPGAPFVQRARGLRDVARRTADVVVWHVIGADAVPAAAFATADCPPVALVDHCDHVFWLGGSVADLLVNLRTIGARHTAARRFVPRNCVVPIPLLDRRGETSRRDARRALGIGDDEVVLLSVGRGVKYRPCGSRDFVATANRILERHPAAHLYVVGESAEGMARYLRCAAHPRLHFVGPVLDPSRHHAAADVYLESFPYGSQTALLEAALSGLPVVPAYAPLCPLLVANDDAVSDVIPNPRSEGEYIERVEALIADPERRRALGEALRGRLLAGHVGQGWLDRLAAVYRETDRMTHRPRPIPSAACMATEVDLGLSRWHVMADGRKSFTGSAHDDAGAAARHAAYVAKLVGNYAGARRHALRAVREDPSRASWRLLAIALLGRAARSLRRLVVRRTEVAR